MDPFIALIIILIGMSATTISVRYLMQTSDAIRRLKMDSEALHTKALAEIRQLEIAIEAIQSRAADRKNTLKELQEKYKEFNDLLSPEKRELRPPLYVAVERRQKGDIEFRARILCPRMSGDWQRGRDYVLWAKDEDTAARNFETKFPPSGGFVIEDVRKAKDPL